MKSPFLLCLLGLAFADHNSEKLRVARSEEISFIDATIKSMEANRAAVIRSNQALDNEVNQGDIKLAQIAADLKRIDEHTRTIITHPPPASSFIQMSDDDNDLELSDESIFQKPAMSVLDAAKAKAATAEKRYRDAMKKLEADKQMLIKDETFRRARAAQERRHI